MNKKGAIQSMQQIRDLCEEQTICRGCPINDQCFSLFTHHPRTWGEYGVPRKAILKGGINGTIQEAD